MQIGAIKSFLAVSFLTGPLALTDLPAQEVHPAAGDIQFTFVPLIGSANAVIAEPAQSDRVRSRIAILIAHPEHIDTFSYFLGPEFARRGYRTMMMNYYGKEQTYEEFLKPLAAAVHYLKTQRGIERVVLAGHSSGGAELTFYQDVAENGAKACRASDRVYPCQGEGYDNLPRADGLMLLDINIGGPLRALAIDPAVNNDRPAKRNRDLDMFDTKNGFDTVTHLGHYSPEFRRKFFAAQQARNQQLLTDALARLAKIEKGQGTFKDDEPFTVSGGSTRINGARLDLADRQLMAHTHAAHVFLKADGTAPIQVVPSVLGSATSADDLDKLFETAQMGTVRHFLSFYGFRTQPDFGTTEDNFRGIDWRSSANSAPGNIEGITVPTLVMAGTCAPHLVTSEIAYDHSPAKDKQFAAVEGADHYFRPCKPQYGSVTKRALDYADAWLMAEGRF